MAAAVCALRAAVSQRCGAALRTLCSSAAKNGSGSVVSENFTRTAVIPSTLEAEETKQFRSAARGGYHAARREVFRDRSALWEMRAVQHAEAETQRKMNAPDTAAPATANAAPGQHVVKTKRPLHSYRRYLLPFSSDAQLRDQYVNMYGDIRIGKLFEDLDAFAAELSYVHSEGTLDERPLTIVTASCDRIWLSNRFSPSNDLSIEGCVAYVGRSSMVVRVELRSIDRDGKEEPVMAAAFTEVAIDKRAQKSAEVHRLEAHTELEKRIHKWGEEHAAREKSNKSASLMRVAPSEEESRVLHRVFLDKVAPLDDQASAEVVPMSETHLSSSLIMFPQEKNVHNKIFGGFMMRQAYELAWAAAHVFLRSRPLFVCSDDIQFKRPVPVGSMVMFDARVTYVEGDVVQVEVGADVLEPLTGERNESNRFHFAFRASEPCTRYVVPVSYEEGMRYLSGRRLARSMLEQPMTESLFLH